ncbi:hypothetical protein PMIN01_12568 [Paraphaeosphaeria minitans]|uniref:Uncharacterized protein n=1 Tax=Paraphaeosphaeria minitans TaxID=565426 RepID=A0A9P6G6E0_9PLEO|nr:hypothetical protein PMIN01_12568 [Paraphaeosphaeria minitans]
MPTPCTLCSTPAPSWSAARSTKRTGGTLCVPVHAGSRSRAAWMMLGAWKRSIPIAHLG